ncbi:MAG TPA: family 10 glycosylhydrolase [Armatimonadota bacterium]|nr:family 10 glycosylhydrolase [Armatimonadota bacterium]
MSLFYKGFLLAMALAAGLEAGVLADTNKEARAIWVVRWDLASPEQVKQAVKYAKDNNFNILVVQVRGRGDAFYKSNFEPRSEYLEGQPLDFDPLALYVEEGHKAGLQIHAWLNTHYTWGSGDPPKSPDHIVNKHPEWLMKNSANEVTLNPVGQSEGAYTCPSNPEVKEHVRNCFLDVVRNYDVDGINFDYVRYPSGDYCYCDGCLARFKAEIVKELPPERIAALESTNDRLAFVQAFPSRWDDWRRKQVTDLVGQVYRRAKDIKPKIVVSADVFPDFDDASNHRFQDWKLWMKMGIMDVLMPMAYTTNTDTFVKQIQDAVSNSNGRHVYGGIGQWQIPVESAIEKILKAREIGAQGINLFAYGPATKDGTDDEYLRRMKEAVFQEPATVPQMDWIK